MTSHGFCAARFGSEFKEEDLAEFVRGISKIRGIIWAHAVEGPHYNVMFEFTHLHEIGRTPEDLLAEIRKITINGRGIHEPIDVWIIRHSCRDGRENEKK